MSPLKRISLGAAAVALVAETGARNLLVWSLVTIGTPATTAAFVYEVVQMRRSRMQHEASDRASVTAKQDRSNPDATDQDSKALRIPLVEPSAEPDTSLRHRLTSMPVARAHFVDIYGANPESVSPAYRTFALTMLAEDERMFAQLEAEKQKDLDGYLFDLQQDESRLRVLHVQVATLAPAAPSSLPLTGVGK